MEADAREASLAEPREGAVANVQVEQVDEVVEDFLVEGDATLGLNVACVSSMEPGWFDMIVKDNYRRVPPGISESEFAEWLVQAPTYLPQNGVESLFRTSAHCPGVIVECIPTCFPKTISLSYNFFLGTGKSEIIPFFFNWHRPNSIKIETLKLKGSRVGGFPAAIN